MISNEFYPLVARHLDSLPQLLSQQIPSFRDDEDDEDEPDACHWFVLFE